MFRSIGKHHRAFRECRRVGVESGADESDFHSKPVNTVLVALHNWVQWAGFYKLTWASALASLLLVPAPLYASSASERCGDRAERLQAPRMPVSKKANERIREIGPCEFIVMFNIGKKKKPSDIRVETRQECSHLSNRVRYSFKKARFSKGPTIEDCVYKVTIEVDE